MTEGPAEAIAAAEREWLDDWHAGPRRTRWERIPLQPGDAAPDAEMVDLSGSLRHLSSFWADGTGAASSGWRTYRYQYCEDWPDPRVLAAAVVGVPPRRPRPALAAHYS
jgi:hypothetical protein